MIYSSDPRGQRSGRRVGKLPGFRRLACFCIAILLASSAGCTSLSQWKANGFKVGPNYHKPTAPVEIEWIDLQDDPRVSADEPDLAAWWYQLNDPVLNQLIEEAHDQNLTVRQAGTRILQAQAIRGVTAGNLFPQLHGVLHATGSEVQETQSRPERRWVPGIEA